MKRSSELVRGNFFGISVFIFSLWFIVYNALALESISSPLGQKTQKPTRTLITIKTAGPVDFHQSSHSNPSRLALLFERGAIVGNLKEEIQVGRGMIKVIYCQYYPDAKKTDSQKIRTDTFGPLEQMRWLRSIVFVLMHQTSYDIVQTQDEIFISFMNDPNVCFKSGEELIIKDIIPQGWGTQERRKAIENAIESVCLTQTSDSIIAGEEAGVSVEKDINDEVRITAKNLTPAQMIVEGAKALLVNSMGRDTEESPKKSSANEIKTIGVAKAINNAHLVKMAEIMVKDGKSKDRAKLSAPYKYLSFNVRNYRSSLAGQKGTDILQASLGLAFLLLGIFVVKKRRKFNEATDVVEGSAVENTGVRNISQPVITEEMPKVLEEEQQQTMPKEDKKFLENMFLKEEELASFKFKPPVDIVERRKYPRADIRNARGILTRALVGSKTQPYKNIRINNISKGGLAFLVRSKELKFKAPTIIKLYFANASKPVDLWVRVVWEEDEPQSDGKNVGAKFTRVPRETWVKIMEAFGHKLG